jgi:hypothetical protein
MFKFTRRDQRSQLLCHKVSETVWKGNLRAAEEENELLRRNEIKIKRERRREAFELASPIFYLCSNERSALSPDKVLFDQECVAQMPILYYHRRSLYAHHVLVDLLFKAWGFRFGSKKTTWEYISASWTTQIEQIVLVATRRARKLINLFN